MKKTNITVTILGVIFFAILTVITTYIGLTNNSDMWMSLSKVMFFCMLIWFFA